MRIAFCLFKYFPYGGLQRDFLDIARECQARGHEIVVYTRQWQGGRPEGFQIELFKPSALMNHAKYERFYTEVKSHIASNPVDCVVGFNKMPGLDVYFASDPSYRARPHSWLARLLPRYKHFAAFEGAVFAPDADTQVLILSQPQQAEYQQSWATPDARFTMMPPGIHRHARASGKATEQRATLRAEWHIQDDEFLLLMIGSGFRTKGLDRALEAIRVLPDALRSKVHFKVIGQDKAAPFVAMAERMGLADCVDILPGRDDIAAVMQAGDVLLHPAYREVAGKVILEAVVGGLPVLVSDVAGYAPHVQQAQAGQVFASPFDQQAFNQSLSDTLSNAAIRQQWRENGIRYGQQADLYRMAEAAADAIEVCHG